MDDPLTSRKEHEQFREKEKAMTRAYDELHAERRRLPMVEVLKDYSFYGPNGKVGLEDLFAGYSQLIVYHLNHSSSWKNCDTRFRGSTYTSCF